MSRLTEAIVPIFVALSTVAGPWLTVRALEIDDAVTTMSLLAPSAASSIGRSNVWATIVLTSVIVVSV